MNPVIADAPNLGIIIDSSPTTSNPGFLSLGTTDILGWIIPVGEQGEAVL